MLRVVCQLGLLSVLAMVILYAFMAQAVPLRKGWQWRIPVILVITACLTLPKIVFGTFSIPGHMTRVVAGPVLLVFAPLWLFQGPVWKRLVINMLFYCCQMIGEAIGVYFYMPEDVAGHVDAFYAQMSTSQILTYGAITQGTAFIFYSAAIVFARTLSARRFRPIYLSVFFLPVSLWGVMMAHFLSLSGWAWSVSILLGGGTAVTLLYYIVSLEEKDALKEQLWALRHTMELEQAHYRTVEERREELARIRHDINNHLSVISRLMTGGEMDDAQQMLARLKEGIDATRETPYCPIPVVNAVLEEKVQLCREKGVGLRLELEIPEEVAVEPLHLCSIFANLMDNAVRGAEESRQHQPEILLSAKRAGDYLFIRTTNPSPEPCAQGPAPALGRGWGIRICREIAGRYGGSYQCTFEDGTYTALVSLLAV